MNRRLSLAPLALLAVLSLPIACQAPPDGARPEDVGTVRVALLNVPTNGTCLRFTTTGGPRPITQKVDAPSGAALTTTLQGLPTGPALSISADAFAGTCDLLKDDSLATYQSDVQLVTLASGDTKSLTFTLRPTGNVTGSVGFVYLTMTPSAFNFGNIVVTQSGPIASFTFKNIGLVPTSPMTTTLNVTSGTAPELAIVTNGCSGMLLPGSTCVVAIRMSPLTSGPKAASLTMSALQGGTLTAMLNGVGWNPAQLSLSPTTASFGNTPLFTPSATFDFTVTNTGDQPSGPILPMLTSPELTIASNQCPGSLAGGQPCHLLVRLTPIAIGTRTGTLTIAASPGGTTSAALSGVGISPLTISPTTATFPAAPVGQAGATQTFTVTNLGAQVSAPLTTVASPAAFRITTNTCAAKPLVPGVPCTLTIQWFPTAIGTIMGTLNVAGATGWTTGASLTGTGS